MRNRTSCPLCGLDIHACELLLTGKVISSQRTHGWFSDLHHCYQCPQCGLGFNTPFPDDSDLREYYDIQYTHKESDEIRRADRYTEFISKFLVDEGIKIKSHLDIGCSRGFLLEQVKAEIGLDKSTGIEWKPEYRKSAQDRGLHVLSDLEGIGRYDLITMLHVLEHVYDPVEFVCSLAEFANDDSLMLVEVPNFSRQKIKTLRFPHALGLSASPLTRIFEMGGWSPRLVAKGYNLLYLGWRTLLVKPVEDNSLLYVGAKN